jgi:hypothetical protein
MRLPMPSGSAARSAIGPHGLRLGVRHAFLACSPHPIDPGWNPAYAPRLAGFPSQHLLRLPEKLGRGYATYYFAPGTFAENSEGRRMLYYPQEASPFWVEVVTSKGDGKPGGRRAG